MNFTNSCSCNITSFHDRCFLAVHGYGDDGLPLPVFPPTGNERSYPGGDGGPLHAALVFGANGPE